MHLSQKQQAEAYRRMLRIRYFEQAAAEQQKAGNIVGALHSSIGQEAAIVGACMALGDKDFITGTHRSHGHPIGKGAVLKPLMAELLGKETGICKGRGGSMHLADASVGIIGESAIVGGGIPLATGAGLSAQVRGSDQVSLCFFGDGAVNEGAFHESLNMASIWKLPVVFFCENNLYAVTTSLARSHGQPDIAKRAEGFGMPGVSVDGQDVMAVYEATQMAVERAREGKGPCLVEARTYRFEEHAVSLSIPVAYRDEAQIEDYKANRDPLVLYKQVLLSEGMGEAALQAIESEVSEEVSEAVAFALDSPLPDPARVYDFMFSNPIHYPQQTRGIVHD